MDAHFDPASKLLARGLAALAAALCAAACASAPAKKPLALHAPDFRARPLERGESGCALRCAKVLAMDEHDSIFDPGLVLVRNGRIEYVGPPIAVPAGYTRIDYRDAWACPGMIDLHSHVQGTGDINEMVLPINPELRASTAYVPGNQELDRARDAGVTTLFGIPGSGTSISGFGLLHKTKDTLQYDAAVIADPGGMKVAQTHNPQRRGGDFGAGWSGLSWLLTQANDRTLAEIAREDAGGEPVEPRLANLAKVHRKQLPVLIHCAASDGVANAIRMWKLKYDTLCITSHGCFDAYKIAPFVAAAGAPMNAGPRTIDFMTTRDQTFVGMAKVYEDTGAKWLSLNTDAPVVPQEELPLQAAMSAHYGANSYLMLRALTIHPALAIGQGGRLGSLEPGKDADIGVFSGDPIDPRSRLELVLIDGRREYERSRDGRPF